MKWIRERDALIAQTLAFVQSVTGKKDEPLGETSAPPGTRVEVVSTLAIEQTFEFEGPSQVTTAAVTPKPEPFQLAPPKAAGEFRNEVQVRVANFRKHQERFEREREEYCAATLAKARATIREASAPRPPAAK